MMILAQFVLIILKDIKNSRSCKSVAMSIILIALMNGLKMRKDALFVMKKFYDFIIFYLYHMNIFYS
jgi:hypothetical protein